MSVSTEGYAFPIVLLVAYAVIANVLAARAFRHRVNSDEPVRGYQIWYSQYFTEEGLRLRRIALLFIVLGGLAVLLVWVT